MGLHRTHVNKRKSARTFRRNTSKTQAINMRSAPQRGGWRL